MLLARCGSERCLRTSGVVVGVPLTHPALGLRRDWISAALAGAPQLRWHIQPDGPGST
jgi:hypothetical protein